MCVWAQVMFDLGVGLCHRMAAEPWYIPAAKMRSLPFSGTSIPSSPSLSSGREHPWLRGYGDRRVCKDLFCSFSKRIAISQPTLSHSLWEDLGARGWCRSILRSRGGCRSQPVALLPRLLSLTGCLDSRIWPGTLLSPSQGGSLAASKQRCLAVSSLERPNHNQTVRSARLQRMSPCEGEARRTRRIGI